MVAVAAAADVVKGNKDRMNKKINDCRILWKNCFNDKERYMDYYFSEKCKNNDILMDIEDNHVVSMVHLNPYQLKWQEKEIKSYYIVGVSTEEKFRKQGRMRKLLEQAFAKMRQEQIPFTYLMPSNKKIYEPFGFQTIYQQERIWVKGIEQKIELETDKLMAASVLKSKINTAFSSVYMKYFSELSLKEQMEVIEYSNKKLSKEFDIYTVRDKKYYVQLQKEMEATYGNIAVFIETFFSECALAKTKGHIVGVVPYCLENGYVEVTESLIEPCFTKEIVELLLSQKCVQEKSDIYFYESYFLDKNILKNMGTNIEFFSKDTIMAKVLQNNKSFTEIFEGQKVYLNEIV